METFENKIDKFFLALNSCAIPVIVWICYIATMNSGKWKSNHNYNPNFFVCDQEDPKTWCETNTSTDVNITRNLASLSYDGNNWIPKHKRFKRLATASHVINFYLVTIMVLGYIFLFQSAELVGAEDTYLSKNKSILQKIKNLWTRNITRVRQFIQYVFVLTLSIAVSQFCKHGVNRLRPCWWFGLEQLTEAINGNQHHDINDKWVSFFSGDTTCVWAAVFSLFFFTQFIYETNRIGKWIFGTIVVTLALIGSIFRVLALMHWFTDVLTAIAVVFFFTTLQYVFMFICYNSNKERPQNLYSGPF